MLTCNRGCNIFLNFYKPIYMKPSSLHYLISIFTSNSSLIHSRNECWRKPNFQIKISFNRHKTSNTEKNKQNNFKRNSCATFFSLVVLVGIFLGRMIFWFFVCFYIFRSKLTLPEIKSISCNLMLCLKFLPKDRQQEKKKKIVCSYSLNMTASLSDLKSFTVIQNANLTRTKF